MEVFLRPQSAWSSSSKTAVYGGAGSSPAVDFCRFEGLVAWCRHYEPVGNALFRKLMHVAFTKWFALSSTSSPFNYPKTAWFREPPVLKTGHLNPSLLNLSVTSLWGCGCLFLCITSFGKDFFSLLQPRVLLLLFLSCMQLPAAGPTKKWYCPLPLAAGGKRDTAPAATDNGPFFRNARTRVPDQNVCVTSRSIWELCFSGPLLFCFTSFTALCHLAIRSSITTIRYWKAQLRMSHQGTQMCHNRVCVCVCVCVGGGGAGGGAEARTCPFGDNFCDYWTALTTCFYCRGLAQALSFLFISGIVLVMM